MNAWSSRSLSPVLGLALTTRWRYNRWIYWFLRLDSNFLENTWDCNDAASRDSDRKVLWNQTCLVLLCEIHWHVLIVRRFTPSSQCKSSLSFFDILLHTEIERADDGRSSERVRDWACCELRSCVSFKKRFVWHKAKLKSGKSYMINTNRN